MSSSGIGEPLLYSHARSPPFPPGARRARRGARGPASRTSFLSFLARGCLGLPAAFRRGALDEAMRQVVASGSTEASPEWAHSVHVEANGLEPARRYFYRFTAAGAQSPIGRTRTAPAAGSAPGRLKFAFASCQHYEQGYYGAWRHVVADEPDLVAFLGDYIYESSWGRDHVRKHDAGEPYTLEDYRPRHALYNN